MAIYSSVPPPNQQASPQPQPQPSFTTTSPIDVQAWTVSALESLNVSPSARGTGVSLSIPLDSTRENDAPKDPRYAGYKPRKAPLRRDSQNNREQLLKGKEGSRRRQRWENDHLLHVPNAQPPLPSDWEVRPTYPVHSVPYYLAPLWDAGVRHRAEEIAALKHTSIAKRAGIEENGKGRVPKDLRLKLKKSKGAKTLLQNLEEEVRKFMREYERKECVRAGKNEEIGMDSEDEEIVFVGRNGMMSDEQRRTVEEEWEREKKVYEAEVGAPSAGFARWLVHSLAEYYGLTSRSVTVEGVKREAWVGIREMKTARKKKASLPMGELPRPLWGMI